MAWKKNSKLDAILAKPEEDRTFLEKAAVKVWGPLKEQSKLNEKNTGRAIPSNEYKKKIRKLPKRGDIERLYEIFNQDTSIVEEHIDQLLTTGESTVFNDLNKVKEKVHPDNYKKYTDFLYLGNSLYDLTYRSNEAAGKQKLRTLIKKPYIQPIVGVSAGVYNAYQGAAELIAVIGDTTGLTEDALAKLEKAMPALDLEEIYGQGSGSFAKAVSVLAQYGLGWSIARKIVTKILKKAGKKKIAGKTLTETAEKISKGSKIGKYSTNLAKFGAYWALPAAIGDTVVSNQSNMTLGDIFGSKDGGKLKQVLAKSKTIDLTGLTGKERAAAVLKNKLIFGAEGTALFGGISLVGPSLKLAAKTIGVGLKYGVEPALVLPARLLTYDITKQGMAITNPWSRAKIPFSKTPMPKTLLELKKFKWQEKLGKSKYADTASLPGWFRLIAKGGAKVKTKLGIPDYNLWKFEAFNGGNWKSYLRRAVAETHARFKSDFLYDPQTGQILRTVEDKIRAASKTADLHMKNLDRLMYKLLDKGFLSNAFSTQTQNAALRHWDDVLRFMRGEIKIDALPKSLRFDSREIRRIIDKQTEQLQPIIKDKALEVKQTLIDNMGKYLHTSYRIFQNSKWRPPKEIYDDAVEYFMKVLKPSYRNLSIGDLKQMAKAKVNDLLTIGRSEGSTSGKRIQDIAAAAKDVAIPGQIFKDMKAIPDEVARLMGRIEDPKNIILNTIMEQAHTLHSWRAYKDLSRLGLNKWIWKNQKSYDEWALRNKITSRESVVPITVRKLYNSDLEGIFRNADGSEMVTLPSMAKAISDNTVLMDTLLKIPFFKSMLAIKAGVQVNKTVLSLMTQMRNITTAAAFSMANGHMGAGASVADDFEMLFKELIGKTDDPKALRELLEEGLEAGALDSSTIASELEKVIPELMGASGTAFRKIKASGKVGELLDAGVRATDERIGRTSDQIFEWLFTNKGTVGKVVQKSIEAYQLGDNIWKLFGYNFTKSQLKPAFKTLDDVKKYFREVEGYEWNAFKAGSSTPGLDGRNLKTIEDAIKEVAGIQVRNVYPNYSMVPRVVGNIRKIPFMGNFVGFTSEMWRNSYQIMRRGIRESKSSNPYIRQMGARRLMGFYGTTVTMGPVLLDTALYMSGVPREMIDAWKERFAPQYQKYNTILPIKWDKEKKVIWGVDYSQMLPYDDVVRPFYQMNDMLQAGGTTDDKAYNVWVDSFLQSTYSAIQPFVSPSIAWEVFSDLMFRNQNNQSVTKNGSIIVDWENDRDKAWGKAMTYMYDKLMPTTLQNIERIVKAFNGQISKHAVAYDPETEVTKAMTGVSIIKIDPIRNFNFALADKSRKLKIAKGRFRSESLDSSKLEADWIEIKNGYAPVYVNELFNDQQKNLYRIWSETYKDIEAMKLFYSESEITAILEEPGRGFSKEDIRYLMAGIFNPKKIPNIEEYTDDGKDYETGSFQNRIRDINREKGTDLKISEFFDKKELEDIYKSWRYIPLGIKTHTLGDELDMPINIKRKNWRKVLEEKRLEKKKIRKEKKKMSFIPNNQPVETSEVSEEVVKTTALPSNINPETGLTYIDDALLSNEEKGMRLRQKGLTA
jgi:hypothetical protein